MSIFTDEARSLNSRLVLFRQRLTEKQLLIPQMYICLIPLCFQPFAKVCRSSKCGLFATDWFRNGLFTACLLVFTVCKAGAADEDIHVLIKHPPLPADITGVEIEVLPMYTKGAELNHVNTTQVDPKKSGLVRIDIADARIRSEQGGFAIAIQVGVDTKLSMFSKPELRLSESVYITGNPGSTITLSYDLKRDTDGAYLPGITSSMEISELAMDSGIKSIDIKHQTVRGSADSPQLKTEEHTLRRAVSLQQGAKLDANFKVNWGFLETGIKAGVEVSQSETYEESVTSKREVTIPGKDKDYDIVWVETYRTGRAKVIMNCIAGNSTSEGKKSIHDVQPIEIPFQFKEGWDLQSREAKK